MTRRAGAAALLAAALLTLVVGPASAASEPIRQAVEDAKPAKHPFRRLTAVQLGVGRQRLDVVIADDVDERTAGLRQRSDLGRYDAMLFAFEAPTSTAFTMSTVPVALDIGFYDANGKVVDRLRMEPCAGSESQCPIYRSSAPFVYALEAVAGDLPRGRLRAVTPPS
jgi:uncharacterized membrane protein (UPF0127 family)